jgi:hypothetical protein
MTTVPAGPAVTANEGFWNTASGALNALGCPMISVIGHLQVLDKTRLQSRAGGADGARHERVSR